MAYRRKGSGKPPSTEEPSRDEPPSSQGTDPEPLRIRGTGSEPSGNAGTRHSGCGPKGSEESARSKEPPSRGCSVCGRRTFLFELPGRSEKYCFECSADVATSMLLTTEIDAATLSGQEARHLIAEFAQLSTRLLARAQLG